MKKGILVYRGERDRFEVVFSRAEPIELHCGQAVEVKHKGHWTPTRIEMHDWWYLVGVDIPLREGMEVRV